MLPQRNLLENILCGKTSSDKIWENLEINDNTLNFCSCVPDIVLMHLMISPLDRNHSID